VRPTLVTGATGFVGWHVARLLIEKGHKVRALVRKGPVMSLDVEPFPGDLRDPASLQEAVAGCGAVFHVAADYRLWSANPSELYQSNVDGTVNILTAAAAAGVDRVVYTSTVGCIGVRGDAEGTEEAQVELGEMQGPYKRSKFLAERKAIEFAAKGLPVTIVNPTAPIGDHDFKPTPTGRIILDYLRGRMPAFIDTGLNFVDVRDVAEGHWLAFEKGKPGERYILGCENLTLEAVFGRLEKISGRPAPKVKIPLALAYLAGLGSTAWAKLSGREPRVPLDAVRMSAKKMWVSHQKATDRLGFQPGSVDQALGRAVDWFRANGYT
jgi:dihydroflavonol-4-reductase